MLRQITLQILSKNSKQSTQQMQELPPPPYRIPVISVVPGVASAIQQKLAALQGSTPVGELFHKAKLEIIHIAPPNLQFQTKQNLEPIHWELTSEETELLINATIVVMDAHVGAQVMLNGDIHKTDHFFQNVQWVQATYAGIDAYHRVLNKKKQQGKEPTLPKFAMTRGGGIMPTAIAQYVIGWIIALERKFLEVPLYQSQKIYARKELLYRPFKPLVVGILGLGDIGQAIGRLVKLAGFQVIGFKRSITTENSLADCADSVTDNLQQVLAQSDYVISILPSTAATHHLLTETNLQVCKEKKPVFINVGRGDVIAEKTLLHALDAELFSRAVLDVFETEPLPSESELWSHPKVVMTPHVSGRTNSEDIAAVFVQNLNLFLQNHPLLYPVDWTQGY